MSNDNKKLALAAVGLVYGITVVKLTQWLHPSLLPQSLLLHLVVIIGLFVPMITSAFYLGWRVVRFVLEEAVLFEERQKTRSRRQRFAYMLLVWLGVCCGFGLLIGSINGPTLWKLSKRGVSTMGHELKTAQGSPAGYEFNVGRQTQHYLFYRNIKTFPANKLTVVYDPLNPQVFIVGDLKTRINNERYVILMAMLTATPFLMLKLKIDILLYRLGTRDNQFSFFNYLAYLRPVKSG